MLVHGDDQQDLNNLVSVTQRRPGPDEHPSKDGHRSEGDESDVYQSPLVDKEWDPAEQRHQQAQVAQSVECEEDIRPPRFSKVSKVENNEVDQSSDQTKDDDACAQGRTIHGEPPRVMGCDKR